MEWSVSQSIDWLVGQICCFMVGQSFSCVAVKLGVRAQGGVSSGLLCLIGMGVLGMFSDQHGFYFYFCNSFIYLFIYS